MGRGREEEFGDKIIGGGYGGRNKCVSLRARIDEDLKKVL